MATMLAAIACFPGEALSQFDLDVERRLLVELLRDGRYKDAIDEARRVEQAVRPARGAKLGPMTRVYVELLIYRGEVEHRMGDLDAAEATLKEAYRQLLDPDFQRMITLGAPRDDGEERGRYFLPLETTFFSLLDSAIEVMLDRAREATHARIIAAAKPRATERSESPSPDASQNGRDSAGGTVTNNTDKNNTDTNNTDTNNTDTNNTDTNGTDRTNTEKLFKQIDEAIRMSIAARRYAKGRVSDEEGDPSSRSPYVRMMLSQARPRKFAGLRYLEASRLPWTLPSDRRGESLDDEKETKAGVAKSPDVSDMEETPKERKLMQEQQRRRAASYLDESRKLADGAIAAALGSFRMEGEDGKSTDPQYASAVREAGRIRSESLEGLADIALRGGDLGAARRHVDRALAELRTAESDSHPELAIPLMLSAEIGLEEGKSSLAAKDAVVAQQKSKLAVEHLRRAKDLLESEHSQYASGSPLHTVLADLLAASESHEKLSSSMLAAADAADAAARRALAALVKSEAARRAKPKPPPADGEPKPAAPPANPPAAKPAG